MPRVPIVPATNEPMAAVASAAPARPLRAILFPSSAVSMVALSPGVLSRIEVVEPPYIAPQYMPANRMNAAVDSTLKVIGNSKAMVSAGPSPGRTPIAVPKVVPTRHHRRFIGVSATAKPLRSCEKASISAALHADRPLDRALDQAGADIDAERGSKAEIGDERERGADQRITDDVLGSKSARDADEQN